MSVDPAGQVTASAAEVYEAFYVPSLFGPWAAPTLDAAGVAAGHRVLDVACGTGVVARAARPRVGAGGTVVGLDVNEGMLAVARRVAPDIEWRAGPAEALPFPDASFDAVVCQFGLQFFSDRTAAIGEMMRVLRPGGRVAATVWNSLPTAPGYAGLVVLLERLFGAEIASELRVPFSLGDPALVRSIFASAGVAEIELATRAGEARFPSLRLWLTTAVKGWALADKIGEDMLERLLTEGEQELRAFATADGTAVLPMSAHIATARRS
jgi:SAM-dependent methyltransferase